MGGRNRVRGNVAARRSPGRGDPILEIAGFRPVPSRWTWQHTLPEFWLREHEGRFSRMLFAKQEQEV